MMLIVMRLFCSLCDPGGARTLDPLIKSQLLYQLSHGVKKRNLLLISDCKGTTIF